MTFLVAIDGPAGTGKSSVARSLAEKLNFIYVDTGAIYRSLAYLVEKNGVAVDDVDAVVNLIPRIEIFVDEPAHCTRIKIDSMLVDKELRTENISRLSSVVSQHALVRTELLSLQRNLVQKIPDGAIFEGRDIGTVVFPHAPLKIFITANSATRAKRRFAEIKRHHPDAQFEDILDDIEKRDKRDETRKNAPMQRAHDAYQIDTSDMTLEEVIEEGLSLIQTALKEKK